jgi:hypothetical protein
MPHGQAVIDMAAIAEAAPVTEAMARDDRAGVVHKRGGQAPTALIEIACSAGIMPRVRDMAAMRQASDAPRLIAMGHEIGDQRLKARREMACHGDRPCSSLNCHYAGAMLRTYVR